MDKELKIQCCLKIPILSSISKNLQVLSISFDTVLQKNIITCSLLVLKTKNEHPTRNVLRVVKSNIS